jgi:hypothetical protein
MLLCRTGFLGEILVPQSRGGVNDGAPPTYGIHRSKLSAAKTPKTAPMRLRSFWDMPIVDA